MREELLLSELLSSFNIPDLFPHFFYFALQLDNGPGYFKIARLCPYGVSLSLHLLGDEIQFFPHVGLHLIYSFPVRDQMPFEAGDLFRYVTVPGEQGNLRFQAALIQR